jgi:hypothetical protein
MERYLVRGGVRFAACLILLFLSTTRTAWAQAGNHTISLGGWGSLDYSETFKIISCSPPQINPSYFTYTYTGFVYVDASGASHSIAGTTEAYRLNGSSTTCHSTYVVPINLVYNGLTIYFLPTTLGGASATVQPVPGFVNLKYVILGVTYAPPGPQSFVQYANNSTISSGTAVSVTSSTDIGLKVSVSSTTGASGTVPDVGGTFAVSDTETNTFSQSFTDEQDSSTSIALSSEVGFSTKVPGPVNSYAGVDHDYDVIWLWLNPLLNFSVGASGPGSITLTGYSYDVDDVPTMDIYGVYLGWLTGRLSTPGPNSSDITPLERTWAGLAANGQIWPTGTSPSLVDPTDYAAIAAADPFSNTKYTVTIPTSPSGNLTSSDGRFTLTGNQIIAYEQPPPGGQPFEEQITESTTKTQTQGQAAKYTVQLGYSWEDMIKTTILLDSWSEDVTASDTITYTNQYSTTNSQATGITATGSITGPPCTVVSGKCSPVYTGPTEYEVFQDNIYGTYMFYPKP